MPPNNYEQGSRNSQHFRTRGARDASVTVVIRSQGRTSLERALASVARQTWPNIEVLVIDATGGAHPPVPVHCGPFPLRLVNTGTQLNRPQAANAGLDHAWGDWLMFLDDDDFYDAGHVASLVGAARAQDMRVAYSGTRLLDGQGRTIGELNCAWGRLRLCESNFIQMGAAMFHRSLLDTGCRFDERLIAYQDWDFWLQLSEHCAFAHTGAVTTNWCAQSGESGAGIGPNRSRGNEEFVGLLFGKWAATRGRLVAFVQAAGRHAQWLLARGKAARAVQTLRAARNVAPDDPGLANLLGISLFEANEWPAALRTMSEAQALAPGDPVIGRNRERVARALTGVVRA